METRDIFIFKICKYRRSKVPFNGLVEVNVLTLTLKISKHAKNDRYILFDIIVKLKI